MHLDGNLHAMICSKLGALDPVGRDHLVPLPAEHVGIIGRPRTGDPVGRLCASMVSRATAEVDNDGYTEFFGKEDGLAVDVAVMMGSLRIGMQGIAVAAERADGDVVVLQLPLELSQLSIALQHRQFAVSVTDIVSRGQFEMMNVQLS